MVAVGALALLLVSFPYAFLAVVRPAGTTYTGVLFSPLDIYAYLGQVLRSHNGDWLLTDAFTYRSFPHEPVYAFYTVLGKVTPYGVTWAAVVLHIARLGFAVLFIGQAWKLYGEVLPDRASRRVAMVLALFTAGTGVFWLIATGTSTGGPPYDLISPQSSTFDTLVNAPHGAAVLFLLAVFLRAFLAVFKGHEIDVRRGVIGGVAATALGLIQPDKIAVLGLGCLLFFAWRLLARQSSASRLIRPASMAFLMLAPGAMYLAAMYLGTLGDPVLRLLGQPGAEPATGNLAIYLLVGYGLPGLLSLVGIGRLARSPGEAPPGLVLLATIAIAGVALLGLNRGGLHPGEGSQFAMAALAAYALVHVVAPRLWRTRFFSWLARTQPLGYDRRRLRMLTFNLVVILSSPSVLALSLATPRSAMAVPAEYYTSSDDQRVLAWMNANIAHDDVVVGTPATTEFVVAYGGARVVYGDRYFTPDYDVEGAALGDFFQGRTDVQGYLRSRGVKWLYFGPREAAVATFDPSQSNLFRAAEKSGGTVLYRVTLAGATQ